MSALRFAIQHRTTRAYLTCTNRTSPVLSEEDTFATVAGAEVVYQCLEDFASAWDIVPIVGMDWPAEFPGAWQNWPADLKEIAKELLLQYWLQEFGPADLVKHIVCQRDRRDPATGLELPFTLRAEKFWPLFLHHARLAIAGRALSTL